ncbi:MAG TPA: hypothetical protein VKG23_05220 [Thermoanaerobaculia bacterium]|nr:hypothetical protein [Thermoanaerobaculia bacterium]
MTEGTKGWADGRGGPEKEGSIMFVANVGLALLLVGPGSTPANRDADTAEIIGLLIDERLRAAGEEPNGSYLVVAAEEIVVCPSKGDGEEKDTMAHVIAGAASMADAPGDLRRELLCQQEGGMLPTASFENARVVSESQIEASFEGADWWQGFYRTFPESRGFLQFTAPAFSSDGQSALIYVSHFCGGLCGTGWLVYLTRSDDGHWRIASKQMLWIS